jgi:hypothetical protein
MIMNRIFLAVLAAMGTLLLLEAKLDAASVSSPEAIPASEPVEILRLQSASRDPGSIADLVAAKEDSAASTAVALSTAAARQAMMGCRAAQHAIPATARSAAAPNHMHDCPVKTALHQRALQSRRSTSAGGFGRWAGLVPRHVAETAAARVALIIGLGF